MNQLSDTWMIKILKKVNFIENLNHKFIYLLIFHYGASLRMFLDNFHRIFNFFIDAIRLIDSGKSSLPKCFPKSIRLFKLRSMRSANLLIYIAHLSRRAATTVHTNNYRLLKLTNIGLLGYFDNK